MEGRDLAHPKGRTDSGQQRFPGAEVGRSLAWTTTASARSARVVAMHFATAGQMGCPPADVVRIGGLGPRICWNVVRVRHTVVGGDIFGLKSEVSTTRQHEGYLITI
jgi:hypothetical protein